jgi:hypothetical protein
MSGRDGRSHPLERTELWHRYRELAPQRALAIAGDPESVWVGGTAAGLSSAEEAEAQALAVCRRQRARRRMQAPCVLYAIGNEVTVEGSRTRHARP